MVTENQYEPKRTGWRAFWPMSPHERVSCACVVIYFFAFVGSLLWFWGINTDHIDRVLVLAGAIWALHSLADHWQRTDIAPRSWWGIFALILGGLSFPVATYLIPQVGPRPLLLWWMVSSLIIVISGYVVSGYGFGRLRVVLFPMVFVLFALPVPARVLGPLQNQLQEVTTTFAYITLEGFGFPVQREGFVLALPSGKLGVKEACSGVRSLTALTAIAAFLAFIKGFGAFRGILLVALSIPIVAAVNILRVIISGLVQEWISRDYIVGIWHESLGIILVMLGLFLIKKLVNVISGIKQNSIIQKSESHAVVISEQCNSRLCSVLLVLSASIAVTFGAWGWSRTEERDEKVLLSDMSRTLNAWTGEDQDIPDNVAALLVPDQIVYRRYVDNVGHEAYIWVLYWNTASSFRGYRDHYPDHCWNGRGFTPERKWIESISIDHGLQLPVVAREYRFQRERQIVMFWTQENQRVLDETELESMNSALFTGHNWVQSFLNQRQEARHDRVSVVVILPDAGPESQRTAIEITRLIANEFYRVCPWAVPIP